MLRDGQVVRLSIGRAIIAKAVGRMDNGGSGCAAGSREYGNGSCPGGVRAGMTGIVLATGVDVLNYDLGVRTVVRPNGSRHTVGGGQNGGGKGQGMEIGALGLEPINKGALTF